MIEISITIDAQPDIENIEGAPEEAAMLCEQVAKQIRQGFTSGYYPTWDLKIK